MGYLSSDTAVNELHELKEHVVRYLSNQYIVQLITAFADKYPFKVFSNYEGYVKFADNTLDKKYNKIIF